MDSKIENSRWMVHWPARTLTPERKLVEGVVCEVAKGSLSIKYPYSLAIGSSLNVEFHVNFRQKKHRIRAKTKVSYCQLAGGSAGALIDLKITQCSPEEIHTLNNILMVLMESNEVDLRVNRKVHKASLT